MIATVFVELEMKCLLLESTLTYDKASKPALMMEAAEQ